MINLRKTSILFLAAALVVSVYGTSLADTGASIIVDNYNSLNGGKGVVAGVDHSDFYKVVNNHTESGELYVRNWFYGTHATDYATFADTSAYVEAEPIITTGTETIVVDNKIDPYTYDTLYYSTFCIAPNVNIMYGASAEIKLNYVNGKSTTSDNHVLSLGAATLYARFASGTLTPYHYGYSATDVAERATSAVALRDAIRFLIGAGTAGDISGTNVFVKYLLNENSDLTHWTSIYDPNELYSEVGDYAVFVMNVTQNGSPAQDLLYVSKIIVSPPPPPVVPEPATVLIWSLGGLGMVCTAWRKRHLAKMKSLA